MGVRNIKPIICVLKNMAHKSVSRLPSHGLTCQMILEFLTVAQAQLGEKLSQSLHYNTLQTDGTSEEKSTYTLGLRHVFFGSAADTLDTFKEFLSDIDGVGHECVSEKIVTSIKNTMSDRHSAEKLCNELLSDYRTELLPKVVENWDEMVEMEKENFIRMNNFFCGLH